MLRPDLDPTRPPGSGSTSLVTGHPPLTSLIIDMDPDPVCACDRDIILAWI